MAQGPGWLGCAAMLLLMSTLHVYTGWQDMGADETSCHSPTLPFEERPWGEKVPQMGCEVYIHCPLLNRLRLMKCLMLRPYQPNPRWQFIPQLPKNTALWPSLATLAAKHREVPSLNKPRQCVIWHANIGHCICKCVITNLHAKTH